MARGIFKLGDGLAQVGGLLLRNPRGHSSVVGLLSCEGTPDASVGKGWAPRGSVCFSTNGNRFVNHGTQDALNRSGNLGGPLV
jgi:hypothetical protein